MERNFFSSWAQADKHKDAYTQRYTRIRAGKDPQTYTPNTYINSRVGGICEKL